MAAQRQHMREDVHHELAPPQLADRREKVAEVKCHGDASHQHARSDDERVRGRRSGVQVGAGGADDVGRCGVRGAEEDGDERREGGDAAVRPLLGAEAPQPLQRSLGRLG